MRAVWSYWSVPYKAHRGFSWTRERTHLLSWILSVEASRKHFSSIALHTDDEGARLLLDGLGLEFDYITTSLNQLRDADPDWWMLGKLQTYSEQQEPFVHLDSDVYLFSPLPERLTTAAVLAQNPESLDPGSFWYDPEACEMAIRTHGDGAIPPAWTWYRTFMRGARQQAACCGIVGGCNVEFLHEYARTVLALLKNPANRGAFDHIPHKRDFNPFFEQYLLAACASYHKIQIEYLFPTMGDAMHSASQVGFTHLMADAKRDPSIAARLEVRVARDYPEASQRCDKLFAVAMR